MTQRGIEEFYIGYLPQSPPRLGQRTRAAAIGLLVLAALVAAAGAFSQRRLEKATFEFGVRRSFTGLLVEDPAPMLLVDRPGAPSRSSYLLVSPYKFGAAELVRGLEGRRVQLEGSLVYRGQRTMLEVVPESLRTLDAGDSRAQLDVQRSAREEQLGTRSFRGEIVDSKCHLGVMNPGRSQVHRACAVRCISGGIPPMLLVSEGAEETSLLLVGPAGRALNAELLSLVAQPVEVDGELSRLGDLLVLTTSPDRIRRLP